MTSGLRPTGSVPALFRQLWVNRSLLATLTRREIEGRYKGSLFGIFWSFLNPLLMLLIFTLVFDGIFKAKWAVAAQTPVRTGPLDFATALFIGLLLYNFFAECLGKAPYLVTNQPNYVKKILFPLEILSVVTLLTALFHFLIAWSLVLAMAALSGWGLHWTALWSPLVIAPFMVMVLGATWLLAALGVYLRDIGQVISPVLTAAMFLSPIFYPLASVGERFLPLYQINPLTLVIEQCRRVLLAGLAPDWDALGLYWLASLGIAYVGFVFFQKTRQGFSDVL